MSTRTLDLREFKISRGGARLRASRRDPIGRRGEEPHAAAPRRFRHS